MSMQETKESSTKEKWSTYSFAQGFAVCERGLEDVSAAEVKELISESDETNDGIVTFPIYNEKELALLCYRAQSLRRVCGLILRGKFTELKDIIEQIKNMDMLTPPPQHDKTSFTVDCERHGTHNFTSQDAAAQVTRTLVQRGGWNVEHENPDLRFYMYISDQYFYLGIDFTGFDLGQREYKVFSHSASLKGPVGYGVLRLAGYEPQRSILSCMSKSGIFEIEAALFATGKSVNYYRKPKFAFWKLPQFNGIDPQEYFSSIDNNAAATSTTKKTPHIRGINADLRHVSAAKKNAKIAGVDDIIDVSRIDVEWMDTKFDKESFDIIIAQPTGGDIRYMREFFKQAAYVLAPSGKLVVVSAGKEFTQLAQAEGFKVIHERVLVRGENKIFVKMYKL